MYTEKPAAARAETQPACGEGTGQLPACGALAFPYVAMQGTDPVRYDDQEALRQGVLDVFYFFIAAAEASSFSMRARSLAASSRAPLTTASGALAIKP